MTAVIYTQFPAAKSVYEPPTRVARKTSQASRSTLNGLSSEREKESYRTCLFEIQRMIEIDQMLNPIPKPAPHEARFTSNATGRLGVETGMFCSSDTFRTVREKLTTRECGGVQ